MKKTIVFKMWKFPRLSETFLITQIITAIKAGFEVKILLDDNLENVEKSHHQALIRKYNLLDKIILEDYKIPQNKFWKYLKAGFLIIINLRYIRYLIDFLKSNKSSFLLNIYRFYFYKTLRGFDLIHVQYGTNVKPLDELKKFGFITSKLIVSFHGHDLQFPINGRIPNNGYYDITFSYADRLVANTPYLQSLLLNFGAPKEKIITIPASVNTRFFRPEDAEKENNGVFRIVSVGRLQALKGHKYGIECVQRLINKGYKIYYTIVGGGDHYKTLNGLVERYNLQDQISLLGQKPQTEVRDILRGNDLFLMTSITDPDNGAESQGLVTAEAQACGLPVIAFDSGGVKYTIEDEQTGFLVPEKDVDAMVGKIKFLINNIEKRLEMSTQAIKFVNESYSQDKIEVVWEKVYKQLIEK